MQMPHTFGDFLDRRSREARKHLVLLGRALTASGMQTQKFMEGDDPYIFVSAPDRSAEFGGIRLYKIGNNFAYRVQRREDTHPYGTAYPLKIEDMFNDLISDPEYTEDKAAKEIVKSVVEQIQNFFKRSSEAEKKDDLTRFQGPKDPMTNSHTVAVTAGGNGTNSLSMYGSY